jgi:hypothetical protein
MLEPMPFESGRNAVVVIVAIFVGAVARFLSVGTLKGMGAIRIRGELVLVAVFVLIVAFPVVSPHVGMSKSSTLVWWLGLMLLLLGLALLNVSSQGFRLIAIGVALNIVAIALNGGMPVSLAAAQAAGGIVGVKAASLGDLFHAAASASTRLLVVGDVLPLPGVWHLRSVLSIGDLAMLVGVVVVMTTSVEGASASPKSRDQAPRHRERRSESRLS